MVFCQVLTEIELGIIVIIYFIYTLFAFKKKGELKKFWKVLTISIAVSFFSLYLKSNFMASLAKRITAMTVTIFKVFIPC